MRFVPGLVNTILLYMELIVAHLMLYPQRDEYGRCHANGKTGYIDE